VLRGLGIETSTSSPSYLSTATTRFIPTTLIQDIVIHEAFKAFEVRFYLAVVVSGQTEVVVVFPVRSIPVNSCTTAYSCVCRTCSPKDSFLKKSGEEPELVCTNLSLESIYEPAVKLGT
jgi:hypothetical protein